MHALTNSCAILLAVLLLFLLIFFAELSYIFCRRPTPSPASKEVLLQFFMCCKKNQSRIEPTGNVSIQIEEDSGVAVETEEEDVAAVDKWRVSRLLFTIEEDDLEMEDDDDESELVRIDIPVECGREPTPFLTPCDSPPYFTPSPSPCRDVDDDVIDVCL
ncbi:unnamed protein product [Eruca vesicaria subsp. sativa]|uniref:Uncharacterized protein n=1 Tax=Eruca vesicaria subsp. sativa TaxID=29727 RepID=A0ABC8KLV3_ERUVS|nr:unnamed protein product [Eruca vesicaria subsp. sativa]